MTLLVTLCYVAAALFVVAVAVRCVKILRMPVHLRWELYPVAHEKNAAYGGSFLEHLDWWCHRRRASRLGDLRVMVPEILLLAGVREHNRSLWRRSYPFHLGLYLLVVFSGLLLIGGLQVAGVIAYPDGLACPDEAVGPVLGMATIVTGVAGMVLLGVGGVGLLFRRLTNPALRAHSAPADFVNLILFIAAASLGLVTFIAVDRDFSTLRSFVASALTWGPTFELPALVAAELVVGAVVVAYIPLTHMSHFFTKWFTYHDVRWNDEVNRVGSKLEAAIGKQLGRKVSWSAPHIAGDGKKTWVDVATQEVGKP
jgi:nitrate reductase gamma subunit